MHAYTRICRHTHRHTQTDRQTDTQQTDRQTDTHTHTHTHINVHIIPLPSIERTCAKVVLFCDDTGTDCVA